MSAIKEQPRSRQKSLVPRHMSCGSRWVESLRCSDVNNLWKQMHRLVCRHPLVRALKSAELLVEEGSHHAYTDLTQELFVQLLSKRRFQHYLDTEMTDAEIECEIGQIELTNLLKEELRKRHPESYRLARRISALIQSSDNFRRFDTLSSNDAPDCRLAYRVYGLSEWADNKVRRDVAELEQRIRMIPVRRRDTRMVGCTGDSQLIISNSDLEGLIISVLKAADAPVNVRTLRNLVLSRLPVMDIYLVPFGNSDDSEEEGHQFELKDECDTPEQSLLRRESEQGAAGYVDRFLKGLQSAVLGKAKQYNRMLDVLWHCYLSQNHGTQLEIAAALGVSDTLVSDYRRRIEQELRTLSFSEIEEARCFEMALRERVQRARKRDGKRCRVRMLIINNEQLAVKTL